MSSILSEQCIITDIILSTFKYWYTAVYIACSLIFVKRRVSNTPQPSSPSNNLTSVYTISEQTTVCVQFYWVNYLSIWTNKTNGPLFTLFVLSMMKMWLVYLQTTQLRCACLLAFTSTVFSVFFCRLVRSEFPFSCRWLYTVKLG